MPKRVRVQRLWPKRKRVRSHRKQRVARPMSQGYKRSRFTVALKRGLMGLAETKEVLINVATNVVVNRNSITNLNNNAFDSSQGVGSEQMGTGGTGSRIGQRIFVKGFHVALHIEAQQYRPKTHWKLFLVRDKAVMDNTISTSGQMYEGHNTNIMLDWLDTSKCDILWSKNFTLRMPNVGTSLTANTGAGVPPDPPGTFDHESSTGSIWTVGTNPSFRGKFYVPVNMNINYRDSGSNIPSVMRYQWVMQAYDNYAMPSSGALWTAYPVGHVSMTTKMKFKDI